MDILTIEESVLRIWKKHFEKLMNVENGRERGQMGASAEDW